MTSLTLNGDSATLDGDGSGPVVSIASGQSVTFDGVTITGGDSDFGGWWSERHSASQFDRLAQPDGLGVWEECGDRVVFCLELDRSTETLERLEKKLKSYEDLQVTAGHAYWICFCFGHPRREAGARRVLANASVPMATASLGPTQRPHEAIWAPVGYEGGRRLRLAELATVPIPPECEARVAENQAYRRRTAEQWQRV